MDNNNPSPYRVLLTAVLLTVEHYLCNFSRQSTIDSTNSVHDEADIYSHHLISHMYIDVTDDAKFLDTMIFILGYQCTVLILKLLLSISGTCSILQYLPDNNRFDNRLYSNTSVCTPSNLNNNNTVQNIEYDSLVVNLSDHNLTPAQSKLLSRGLKFCPNPGEPDVSLSQTDLDAFHLRIKRFLHFFRPKRRNDLSESIDTTQLTPAPDTFNSDQPFQHQKFKNPSDWMPPPVAPLEFFISKNNLDLAECIPHKPGRNNITKPETLAIKELAQNKHIIIKPADKGGSVVILNRNYYLEEGFRQLSDANFYSEQQNDLSHQFHNEIIQILDDMLEHKQIDRSCHKYLTDRKIRTAQFYMLPKIHKNRTRPPGRPIVSGNGCPTERISKFVDFFLQPGVKLIRSYIRDTSDFLLMLRSLNNVPEGCILVTLDVSSLYTNIPNVEGCLAVEELLNSTRSNTSKPSNEYLLKLLKKVLHCNNFDFNGRHFLQVGGTAMGTKVAPAYANTFMGWFEESHVYTYHQQPLLWKRFIDDIFMVWHHNNDELNSFIEYLNSRMPSIKFEAESSTESVHFLDVTVKIANTGAISTTLYTKPTDAHNYINYYSCHPRSCRRGIPYGQFLRLRRICSNEEDFVSESRILALHFRRADYPKELIQSSFERAFLQDRNQLLIPKPDQTSANKDNLYLITTHHPTFREVNNIVSRNLDLLDRSSSTRPIIQANIIRGFRRCPNLRDHLVRARIMPLADPPALPQAPSNRNRCRRAYCNYCSKLDRTGTIISSITNRRYTTRTNISCNCTNLIYALRCSACGKIYVGQTKRRIMDRLMEHLRNIRQRCDTHIVGRHYNSQGHDGTMNVIVHILEFIPSHPDSATAATLRDQAERKWIFRLRSLVPMGLNLFD